jgi:hypothetical protein
VAPGNLDVGTRLWYENGRIRVWEVRLHSPDEPLIHGLENVGETPLRFVTVELLD